MGTRQSLADPDFEPTDEQLTQLAERAFAAVRTERERALREMRARIELERQRILHDLAERSASAKKST